MNVQHINIKFFIENPEICKSCGLFGCIQYLDSKTCDWKNC